MAYTLAGLTTKLRTQISDPALDSTVSTDALNNTIQDVFNRFELTLNSSYPSNSVVAGTNTLATALPTDLQRITALLITSPNPRDITNNFIPKKEFRMLYPTVTTTNQLSDWTFFTGVEFSTLADVDNTIRIEYIKTVPLLTNDSDIPTIPQAYEELLMIGAKIRVYEQKEDFDYAKQYEPRYNDLLEQFVQRYSTRQIDAQFVVPGSRRKSVNRIV